MTWLTTGDARDLSRWDAGAIQTVVTSPPYWGQRDYGFPEQIGIEADHHDYIETMVGVGRELRRCLRPDGTWWLNLGDTFNTRAPIRQSAHQGGLGHDNASIRRGWSENARMGLVRYSARQGHYKDKDLLGIPHRVADALVSDGWYLRADVIWSKPWCSPENASDRPSRSHEYLFLLSAKPRYFYDKAACPEGHRSVWEIAPGAGTEHRAVMPAEMVRRCLLLTSRSGDVVGDCFAGSGTTLDVAHDMGRIGWGIDGRLWDEVPA